MRKRSIYKPTQIQGMGHIPISTGRLSKNTQPSFKTIYHSLGKWNANKVILSFLNVIFYYITSTVQSLH